MNHKELSEIDDIEIDLLLEAIHRKYGYDFREYSRASLRRRLLKYMSESKSGSISEIQHKLLYDPGYFNRLAAAITVNVTEMFRDPQCFKAIKELILPELMKIKHIRIWHAGCSTGEEVYSMAIMLSEAGILDRCQIYATDTNDEVLEIAANAIYPMDLARKYTINYQTAGGEKSFSEYYTAKYDNAVLKKWLGRKVLFSLHNLAVDSVFAEVDLVMCRNVLIYFKRELQNRVLKLFTDSLAPGGFLIIGSKESIHFSGVAEQYEIVDRKQKIYRKKTGHG